jgi:hypothetical protein
VPKSIDAKPGRGGKSIEEVVSYAVGHRIRVHALVILSEGVFTAEEVARIIGEPTNRVAHHIKELVERGSIELAKTEQARNTIRHYYRAVEMPIYSDEEVAAMTPQQRQIIAGLCLQQMMAEAMAAFWAGNMNNDPRVFLVQRWFNVDARGREEIADEQAQFWERMMDIETEALNRCAKTGEEPRSVIVAELGYFRERTGPAPPPPTAEV